MAMAVHHRWSYDTSRRSLWLSPLSRYAALDQSALSFRRGARFGGGTSARTTREVEAQFQVLQACHCLLAMVGLRRSLGDRRRNRVFLIKLAHIFMDAGPKTIFSASTQQLPHGCDGCWHRCYSLLGHADRLPWWQEIPCRILYHDDRHHNFRNDPRRRRA